MAKAAVFDVDGTLVDTNHLHVVAWWEAFRQAGRQVAMHDIHRAVGLPSRDLITHVLAEEPKPEEGDALSAAHKALYGTYFERLPPLPEAGRLLRRLDGQGWRVVLATSASGPELAALRRAIGADDAIMATASAEDVAEGKPAPDPVEHALELAKAPAERSVFVGDTVWDMRAGVRAGVRCVAVLSGGIPRPELEAAGAEMVFRNPAHLLAALDDSPLGREE
ncbi:HAD family hydrolase [Streptomyces sp. NPDC008159]|uniref:HAD family hydrolase n=1 Tax=Streptomyces sp. NPDC008159 TaxID=3364817 RepID=UPI0036E5A7B4